MLTDFPAAITGAPVNGPEFLQRIDDGLYWGDVMTGEPGADGLLASYPSVWNLLHAAMQNPDYQGSAMDDVLAERERRAAAGLPDFEHGVADTVEQVTEKFPGLLTDPRSFAITFIPITKAEQPAFGGWRWEKWGTYIGNHTPQADYLADEPVIAELVCFEIHEIHPVGEPPAAADATGLPRRCLPTSPQRSPPTRSTPSCSSASTPACTTDRSRSVRRS